MNINLKRFTGDPSKVTILGLTMGLSKFRPGALVKYIHEIKGGQTARYRVIGVTLSEDISDLLGFYYSIQHPTIRTVYHDVAEYELETADEQRNPVCGSVSGNEGVLGIPDSGRPDQQDRDAGYQPAAPGQAGSDPLQ